MHDRKDLKQACIEVGGPDAESFLQNQLTADAGKVGGSVALAAWCTAKGRVIVVFRLRRTDGGFSLALPADLVDAVDDLELPVLEPSYDQMEAVRADIDSREQVVVQRITSDRGGCG